MSARALSAFCSDAHTAHNRKEKPGSFISLKFCAFPNLPYCRGVFQKNMHLGTEGACVEFLEDNDWWLTTGSVLAGQA
jgi:hypothetical protein